MERVFKRRHLALAVLTGFALAASVTARAGASGDRATEVPGLGLTVYGIPTPAAGSGTGGNPLAPVSKVVNEIIGALATPPANPVMPISPIATLHGVIGSVTEILGEAGGLLGRSTGGSGRAAGLAKPAGRLEGVSVVSLAGAGGSDAAQTITVVTGGPGTAANAGAHGVGPLGPVTSLISNLAKRLPK
ncbi:hypothetical protein Bsp3421_002041 [Burkholderia sp. FERM BP-3421]|uniref:hypothetical protein n=1 Tax=Burkholderia sp. FERM BP-3421 TaxID=1494466 RepID=UPI002362EB22|nr:hypothetical protein [Burkholderia sp. FERM BP-3421]WDD92067.1 hypothetical protein Bsp3421_002041 [Burkholderia sp. FERM BP-3421]